MSTVCVSALRRKKSEYCNLCHCGMHITSCLYLATDMLFCEMGTCFELFAVFIPHLIWNICCYLIFRNFKGYSCNFQLGSTIHVFLTKTYMYIEVYF